ncbi:ATP-binding protein [Cellulomonas sp.]|uniref:ATP-binding protein n=1 Tax=Cellulomonas sp. TaxID=40001 RepID=UPI001AFDF964|nr:ATP-binding protein [Cellulomonas sp.]MBO9553432.1 ATP-binding protein [Cellulomonas sp.]
MTERAAWTVTTHDWSADVDRDHLAAIRARPDVYAAGGRRHLILEVLAYADEEAASIGRVGRAVVTGLPDGSVSVADDGRGTDTRVDEHGRVIRKHVMATKDVRFFDAVDAPTLPDGLPRRGMSTVAALSEVLVHENHRATGAWSQTYRHGVPDGELHPVSGRGGSGTTVTFRPDPGVGEPAELAGSDLVAFRWLVVELR